MYLFFIAKCDIYAVRDLCSFSILFKIVQLELLWGYRDYVVVYSFLSQQP